MKAEEFEALKAGDLLKNDSTGEVYVINQVRMPGFYVVVRVDPVTFERLDTRTFATTGGEGLTKVERKKA